MGLDASSSADLDRNRKAASQMRLDGSEVDLDQRRLWSLCTKQSKHGRRIGELDQAAWTIQTARGL